MSTDLPSNFGRWNRTNPSQPYGQCIYECLSCVLRSRRGSQFRNCPYVFLLRSLLPIGRYSELNRYSELRSLLFRLVRKIPKVAISKDRYSEIGRWIPISPLYRKDHIYRMMLRTWPNVRARENKNLIKRRTQWTVIPSNPGPDTRIAA